MQIMEDLEKDLHSLIEHIDCFNEKHGGSIVMAAAMDLDDNRAACPVFMKGGKPEELHMLCHALLKAPRFVDEMMDAIKCVIKHNAPQEDGFGAILMEHSMDALKKLLILVALKEEKERNAEKDADKIVNDFLDDFYHGEGN